MEPLRPFVDEFVVNSLQQEINPQFKQNLLNHFNNRIEFRGRQFLFDEATTYEVDNLKSGSKTLNVKTISITNVANYVKQPLEFKENKDKVSDLLQTNLQQLLNNEQIIDMQVKLKAEFPKVKFEEQINYSKIANLLFKSNLIEQNLFATILSIIDLFKVPSIKQIYLLDNLDLYLAITEIDELLTSIVSQGSYALVVTSNPLLYASAPELLEAINYFKNGQLLEISSGQLYIESLVQNGKITDLNDFK
ncbi:unnamed protein product, partial [Didymodactylos carnosus]